jgi:hypothetical protein
MAYPDAMAIEAAAAKGKTELDAGCLKYRSERRYVDGNQTDQRRRDPQ